MRRRLLLWWRRDGIPAGRHVRVLPSAAVPGAAATIVASASLDPDVTGYARALEPPPAASLATWVPPAPGEVTDTGTALVLPAPGPDGRHDLVVHRAGAVGLVFADGDRIELDDADPRVRTFRAAVAALLDEA